MSEPYVTAEAKTYLLSGYEGSEVHLFVDGDFSYIKVSTAAYDYGSEVDNEIYTKSECGDYIKFNINAIAQPDFYFRIVPFDSNNGTMNKAIRTERYEK